MSTLILITLIVEYDESDDTETALAHNLLPTFEEIVAKEGLSIDDSYTEVV